MTILAIVLILINLGLWFIFLIKFKSLFSTDDVIEKTRSEMEKLVKDINHNAETNINLIEDRIRKLKSIVKESDLKLQQIETRLSLLNKQVADSLQKLPKKNAFPVNEKEAASKYIKNRFENGNASYSVTKDGLKYADKQKTLFDEENQNPMIDTKVQMNVNSSGDSYAEIPLVEPRGFEFEVISQNQNSNQNQNQNQNLEESSVDLKEKVIQLYNQGEPLEQIAQKLSLSPAEVQFVLDFI